MTGGAQMNPRTAWSRLALDYIRDAYKVPYMVNEKAFAEDGACP
jgi:hypothetical protein